MITIATLVGCAIGDALGNPFEMFPAHDQRLVSWDGQFKAGGTFWKGNAGQYTDDTLMSIALSKSLIQCGSFNPEDVANEYLAWRNTGNTRGIGNTTAEAIHNLKVGKPYTQSGLSIDHDGRPIGGNGTAMRASPIGLVYRNDLMKVMEHSIQDASITHNSLEPQMGSAAVALAVALLVNGVSDPISVLADVKDALSDSLVKEKIEQAQFFIEQKEDCNVALAQIGSGGYVPETVGAAFYCLAATKSFDEAVVMAVRAGGDTDTTAAVVGAMAGTYYGLECISSDYKDNVENFELLNALTEELMNIEI